MGAIFGEILYVLHSFLPVIHYFKLLTGAMQINTTSFGSGPIFLEGLDCTTSDTDLLSCRTIFTSVGLTGCKHSQDVSVRCQGIFS